MSLLVQIILGIVVGIFSGLLGVGGGILMIPALLYVYPALVPALIPASDPFLAALTMKNATGVAAIAALGGSFSASITHYFHKNAHLRLMLFIAIGTSSGSYLGSYTSGFYSNLWRKIIYAVLLLFILLRYLQSQQKDKQNPPETPTIEGFELVIDLDNKLVIAKIWGLALVIGYLSGLIGIGGAVMLIPLMIHFLNVPLRLAIGSTSGIVFLSAIAMVAGKWHAGLIPMPWALVIALSALPGGLIGAMWSKHLSERFLHGLLMFLIALTLLRVIWELVVVKVSG